MTILPFTFIITLIIIAVTENVDAAFSITLLFMALVFVFLITMTIAENIDLAFIVMFLIMALVIMLHIPIRVAKNIDEAIVIMFLTMALIVPNVFHHFTSFPIYYILCSIKPIITSKLIYIHLYHLSSFHLSWSLSTSHLLSHLSSPSLSS